MKKIEFVITIMISVILVLICSNLGYGAGQKYISWDGSWTVGGVGGTWYAEAVGIAEIVKRYEPKLNIKVVPGGGTLNIPRVDAGESAQLGWGTSIFMVAGQKGLDPYNKQYGNVRAIAGSFMDNPMTFIAGENTGITTIDEFIGLIKEKKAVKIAVTITGGWDDWGLRKILGYYGLTYEDIKKAGGKIFQVGYSERTTLLKDRHIDYDLTWYGYPASYIQSAAIGRKLRILKPSQELLNFLHDEYGYTIGEIPAGVYPNIVNNDKNIPTCIANSVIIANVNVPEEVVYSIAKIVCENEKELHKTVPQMKCFKAEAAFKNLGIPLHSGAEKYYREKGYIK